MKNTKFATMEEKICKDCGKSKPIDDFPVSSTTNKGILYLGRRGRCKLCYSIFKSKDPAKYLEKIKLEEERIKLSLENKKRCTICSEIKSLDQFPNDSCGRVHDNKKSYCKECSNHMRKDYMKTQNGKLRKAKWDKKYSQNNREKINVHNSYKYHNDIQYKLKVIVRKRLNSILKTRNIPKTQSSTFSIGCSYEYLIKHLENQFVPGMTWNNHSLDGWHIDHKKALANFDLTDPKQFKEATHYTNLQPLWSYDNLSKSNKF